MWEEMSGSYRVKRPMAPASKKAILFALMVSDRGLSGGRSKYGCGD
jgi:hypothetical protein